MELKDRIVYLRKEELKMTQSEFAKGIGVSTGTIGGYEAGLRNPLESVLTLICRTYKVNYSWLKNEEGEIFEALPDTILDDLLADYGLNAQDRRIVSKFVSMDERQRKLFLDTIKELFSE